MKVITTSQELKSYLKTVKIAGKSIGFVPTMGALHEGHLSLIEQAKKASDFVVASIFVNPLQFNNQNDLKLYPRTIESDSEKLEKSGCDLLFLPSESDIYTENPKVKLSFGLLEEVMEGKFRPGHFNGVAIVVSKLFHLVQPDHAFFGQKDLQQYRIIHQLVSDLSFPLTLHCCPILRETDGLAMSSRNKRIPSEKRKVAAQIYSALTLAKEQLLQNQGAETIKNMVSAYLIQFQDLKLEYFEIVNAETLEPLNNVTHHRNTALCIAVYLEEIRLIDNIVI